LYERFEFTEECSMAENRVAIMRGAVAAGLALLATGSACRPGGDPDGKAIPSGQVAFYGNPTAAISAGVIIPPNRSWMWTSGTTPAIVKADAPAGSRERFGDTRVQATSILKTLTTQLEAKGLAMKDVVYLRAYLVPDAEKGNKLDMEGWTAAYKESFGTSLNQTKPARSTVGVAALVNPDFLIEIEAFAVFPTPP
jgi:enamine deaminase RidA (YjgF/YER057c/UK114 family)